ncbi:hypothetical protein FQR65_LT20697 [Abscondita terminalis]|nr:hypothetical protein FQR65_LT20697 [Abscondita terminalis]
MASPACRQQADQYLVVALQAVAGDGPRLVAGHVAAVTLPSPIAWWPWPLARRSGHAVFAAGHRQVLPSALNTGRASRGLDASGWDGGLLACGVERYGRSCRPWLLLAADTDACTSRLATSGETTRNHRFATERLGRRVAIDGRAQWQSALTAPALARRAAAHEQVLRPAVVQVIPVGARTCESKTLAAGLGAGTSSASSRWQVRSEAQAWNTPALNNTRSSWRRHVLRANSAVEAFRLALDAALGEHRTVPPSAVSTARQTRSMHHVATSRPRAAANAGQGGPARLSGSRDDAVFIGVPPQERQKPMFRPVRRGWPKAIVMPAGGQSQKHAKPRRSAVWWGQRGSESLPAEIRL